MEITRMNATRLLNAMADCHVVIVGDLMLDEYLWGEIARISPEAPVPVLNLRRLEHSLGGAANVARNVASLGARVSMIGVVGADRTASSLFELLDRAGIDREAVLIEGARPTTCKCRLMSLEHSQQVFRFDHEVVEEISPVVEDRLLGILRDRIPIAQTVICSDYLKGVLTQRVLFEIAALARQHGVPIVTAPKDTRPEKYLGASVLMANLHEFAQLVKQPITGDAVTWIDQAATCLLDTHHFPTLIVTRGREGMTLFEQRNGCLLRQDIASVARGVYDVTGAGDTALSVFALALAAGAARNRAAYLANIAAGIVVGKRGTACVTVEELVERVSEIGVSLSSAA